MPSSCRRGSAKFACSPARPSSSNDSRPLVWPVRTGQQEPRRRIDAPLADLHGVGARRAADLAKAGLVTLEDLLLRFPIRYEDRSSPQPIAALKPGGNASVVGEVIGAELKRTRRPGFTVFELRVRDDSGTLTAVFFNQRFLRDVFHRHQQVALFGKVELTGHGVQMQSPQYEILGDASGPDDDAALETPRLETKPRRPSRCTTAASCRSTSASDR